MLAARLRALFLTVIAFSFAGVAQAGIPGPSLYTASWIAESFGNDVVGGSLESNYFSVFGIPQGILCNPLAPRCKYASTPTDTGGNFNPLGPNCHPLTAGELPRPAKGATATVGVAPLYRNPFFFTSMGSPKTTSCTAYSTASYSYATAFLTTNDPARGLAMKGKPVSGFGTYTPTGTGFKIPAAAAVHTPGAKGMHRTTIGEFNNIPPYLYSYTYATLRNDKGTFAKSSGFFTTSLAPATLNFPYSKGGKAVASITVKKGANQFGGVMRLLGKFKTKVCYFYAGGCSLGGVDWYYQTAGDAAYKKAGVVTAPYVVGGKTFYYNTELQSSSLLTIIGERFPWTTGSVTVTATGRGPHKTIERRKGFDTTATGGTRNVQLVSPILTHWLGALEFETGGIAILKISLPEPTTLMGLVAGLSLLGVLYRVRPR